MKTKTDYKSILIEINILTIAIAIIAVAVYFFLVPSHTSISSMSGLGIVLSNFVPLPLSAITMILNVVLLIIGFFTCGKEFGLKTVYTSVMLPVFLGIFENIFPNTGSITNSQELDVLCYILVVSVGLSILFNRNASSCGLEIVAMIKNKFFHMELGKAMSLSGMCVTLSAALVYDKKTVVLSVLGKYFNDYDLVRNYEIRDEEGNELYLTACVDERYINRLLSANFQIQPTWLAILDPYGNIVSTKEQQDFKKVKDPYTDIINYITSKEDEQIGELKIDGRNYILNWNYSAANNWYYVSVTDAGKILSENGFPDEIKVFAFVFLTAVAFGAAWTVNAMIEKRNERMLSVLHDIEKQVSENKVPDVLQIPEQGRQADEYMEVSDEFYRMTERVCKLAREALKQMDKVTMTTIHMLQTEGLIVSDYYKSMMVREITDKDIQELYQLRELLEGAAFKEIFTSGRQEEYSYRIEEKVVRMCAASGDLYDWEVADTAMHMEIISIFENERINRIYENNLSELIRIGQYSIKNGMRIPRTNENLKKMVQYMRKNNYEKAFEILKADHFGTGKDSALKGAR